MANLIATREAVERFAHELPLAGILPDQLRRNSRTTTALIDAAIHIDRASTQWIDHNLAVIVAAALAEPETRSSAQVLFNGIRRRLAAALTLDGDDLALALALARGARGALDDARSHEDIAQVAKALDAPHGGPALVEAAVALVVTSHEKNHAANAEALAEALPRVCAAVERLSGQLPRHPNLGLHRVNLDLITARSAKGKARQEALEKANAGIKDHLASFGESQEAQRILGTILELMARSKAGASAVIDDTWKLLNDTLRRGTLRAQEAGKLLRTLDRAGGLLPGPAKETLQALEAFVGTDRGGWNEAFSALYRATGNEAGLMTLWEQSLRDGSNDRHAAAGLAERLIANLRSTLKPPFDNEILGRVLDSVPPAAMARWSAADISAVLDVTQGAFGPLRALGFLTDRVLHVAEHRKKASFWDRSLTMAEGIGKEAFMQTARVAMDKGRHQGARLALAEILAADPAGLREAEEMLRPLMDSKGTVGAKAQQLRRKISQHPSMRVNRREALMAFEESLEIGSSKAFELRVAHVARNYFLAEIVERPAPRFYDHKHLRVMVRAGDLPRGFELGALRKGDVFHGPIRGADGDGKRDKQPRIYWLADPSATRSELTPAVMESRLTDDEKRFAIGSGKKVRLRVSFDSRRSTVYGRVLAGKGKSEFGVEIGLKEKDLPEGVTPPSLGRGKLFWGVIENVASPGKARRYALVGDLDREAPKSQPQERVKAVVETDAVTETEVVTEAKPEVVTEAKPEVVKEAKPEVVTEAKPEVVTDPEVVTEAKPEVVTEAKPEVATVPEPEAATEPEVATDGQAPTTPAGDA